MKDNNIWYILIVFFVIMIFIPPLLRFAIPAPVSYENDSSEVNSNNDESNNIESDHSDLEEYSAQVKMTCTNSQNTYTISSYYSDKKTVALVFTSDFLVDENYTGDDSDTFISNIIGLKQIPNVELKEKRMIFNFNTNDFSKEQLLKQFTYDLDTQRSYYEQLGLNCTS